MQSAKSAANDDDTLLVGSGYVETHIAKALMIRRCEDEGRVGTRGPRNGPPVRSRGISFAKLKKGNKRTKPIPTFCVRMGRIFISMRYIVCWKLQFQGAAALIFIALSVAGEGLFPFRLPLCAQLLHALANLESVIDLSSIGGVVLVQVDDVNVVGGRCWQVRNKGGRTQLQGLGHRVQIVANPLLDRLQVFIRKTFGKRNHTV